MISFSIMPYLPIYFMRITIRMIMHHTEPHGALQPSDIFLEALMLKIYLSP